MPRTTAAAHRYREGRDLGAHQSRVSAIPSLAVRPAGSDILSPVPRVVP
jgi:hypothetical protein